jgi:hypothetical protein
MEKGKSDYQKNAFIEKLVEIVRKSESVLTERPRRVPTESLRNRFNSTTVLIKNI